MTNNSKINIPQSRLDILNAINQQNNLDIKAEVLHSFLNGFNAGRNWLLDKLNIKIEFPALHVGRHVVFPTNLPGGYNVNSDGEQILVQADYLQSLNEILKSDSKLGNDYGPGLPLVNYDNIEQFAESFAIEEYLHWAQRNQLASGLAFKKDGEILKTGESDPTDYLLQPH